MTPLRKGIIIATFAFIVLFLLLGSWGLVENVGANEITIIQSPWSGELAIYTTPGPKWQGFGKVTTYLKRSHYSFSKHPDVGSEQNQSIQIRFNDGAQATLSGSVNWEMPLDEDHLRQLHYNYGSQSAIEQSLVRPVVEKAVYMTGPLMSSKESYAEKRPMILQYIEDQIQNGVYSTQTTAAKQVDPLTNQERVVNIVEIRTSPDGTFLRTEESPLGRFGIRAFNAAFDEVGYSEAVEAQIQQQQAATMAVQIAVANAKKAEQDAITATQNGLAAAAQATADQNVQLAAQKVKVTTAEAYKQEQILRADGDAYARQKLLSADGGLEMKVNAYLKAQELWAGAFERHQGNLFPQVLMGSSGPGGANQNGLSSFMDLMAAKSANDLSLNLKIPSGGQPPK